MAGVSIEETLELWASSLRAVKARMRPLFLQERMAASAGLFLDGLLGGERRKTGWSRAEAAGDPGPWRQQAILGRAQWDADALRDIVRDYALETLADADAVLVIDETGFLKQGKASCGVGRQYTGSAGKITNCQIGVFAAYASRHGHAFVDRALYLPKAWTDDPARMAAAHVPDDVGSPPNRSSPCDDRAGHRGGVPFAWVAADTVYGTGDIEMALRRAGKGYVLGTNANHPFHSWGKDGSCRARRRRSRASCRNGLDPPVGRRRHQGRAAARLALPRLADLDAGEFDAASTACGREACSSGAASPTDRWPSSRPGARSARRSRPSSPWKAAAGPSRTPSRPPRTNSASTTTRPLLARLAPPRLARHDRLGASAGVVEGVGPEELAGRHGAFDLVASFRSAETAPSRQVQALNI